MDLRKQCLSVPHCPLCGKPIQFDEHEGALIYHMACLKAAIQATPVNTGKGTHENAN